MDNRDIETLKPHPANQDIYGDTADDDLVASVRIKGVLEPLLITSDGTIVSGHRRYYAAKAAGKLEVPVRIHDFADDLELLETLIHLNKQRQKTREVIAREAKVLFDVERERRKRNQQATQFAGKDQAGNPIRSSVVGSGPPPNEDLGKARDKVGEKLGMDGRTAERAAQVATVIEELEEEGDSKTAEEIRQTLNERGFKPAHRQAKETGRLSKERNGQSSNSEAKPEKRKRKKRGSFREDPDKQVLAETETSFREMLSRVSKLGRVKKEKFLETLGGITSQRWFFIVVDELHYMRVEEDVEKGTMELVIDEEARDLCKAVRDQLYKAYKVMNEGSKFKFDYDLLRKTINDLIDLVCKAAT